MKSLLVLFPRPVFHDVPALPLWGLLKTAGLSNKVIIISLTIGVSLACLHSCRLFGTELGYFLPGGHMTPGNNYPDGFVDV